MCIILLWVNVLIICHVIHREDERVEQRNLLTFWNEEPWRAPIIYNISKCGSHFRHAGEVLTDLRFGLARWARDNKSLSKILLKTQKNCQREALNFLFMVADPFSKKSFCTAVFMMFAPLQSSTLRRRPGRGAVRLACRQKLVSAATASAVTDAVHSAPAPLASTILILPWQSCSLAKRRRSTCKNNFYIHTLLLFKNFYTQSLEDEEDDESEDDDEGGENFSETEIFELF